MDTSMLFFLQTFDIPYASIWILQCYFFFELLIYPMPVYGYFNAELLIYPMPVYGYFNAIFSS